MNAHDNILMIDIDDATRDVLTDNLERRGYEIDSVNGAQQAFLMLRKHSYAAAIASLQHNSAEAVNFIKSVSQRNHATPVIALVHNTQTHVAATALSSGAYDCISLPIDNIDILIAVTARAVERSRLILENRQLAESVKAHSEGLANVTRKLRRLVTVDETTNLRNQRHFYEALAMEISRCQRHQRAFSILLIKINHFDLYKQRHGVKASDLLLYSFAMLLRDKMRVSDTVARYEENEFALLLPETDHAGVLESCQRLLDAVYAYPFPGRESFPDSRITLSMGSATFPEHGNTSGALIEHGIASSRPW